MGDAPCPRPAKETAVTAVDSRTYLDHLTLAPEVRAALEAAPRVIVPATRDELHALSLGPDGGPVFSVDYDVEGEVITEATVTRCRNGIAVNYPEDYMRRRDPQCMVIADDRPTDKTTAHDKGATA